MGGGRKKKKRAATSRPRRRIAAADGRAARQALPALPAPGALPASPPPLPAVGLALRRQRHRRPALRPRRRHRRPDGRRRRRPPGSLPGVGTFVVPAGQIARYAAIAQGVEVNRVPALVVLRPKQPRPGHPTASVQLRLPEPGEHRTGGDRRRLQRPHARLPPVSDMDSRDFPSHLRPVPDSGDSTAPALEPEAGGTPGLTPPLPAAAPAASSPTSSSTSATSTKSAPARRSKRRAPPASRPSGCCSSRARSTPTSSPARSPSATASTTSTSPPTRSTWRRRT